MLIILIIMFLKTYLGGLLFVSRNYSWKLQLSREILSTLTSVLRDQDSVKILSIARILVEEGVTNAYIQ